MTNVGIDLNALNNRLSFTLDAFHSKTTDILFTPSIYLTVGNKTAPRQNIAKMVKKGVELTAGWQDKIGEVSYSINANFSYTPNEVTLYKGQFEAGYNEDGEWESNIGDVASSSSAVDPIVEGHSKQEFYLKSPYTGSGKGYEADGIHGGPVDGMIRTEQDMVWVQAMIDAGYTFMPNQSVAQDRIWYGDYIFADANGDGIKNYYMNNVDDQDAAIKAFIDALDKAYNSDAEPDEMYQLGLQLGTTLARQKAEGLMGNEDLKFDYDLAMQGMKQGIEGVTDSTAWSPADAQNYIQETMMQLQAEKAAKLAAEREAQEAAEKAAVEEDTVTVDE